jgi:flagellar motility protein MotE (MotC chaperone)
MNNYQKHFQKIKKQKKMSLGYQSGKIKKESPYLQFLGLLALLAFCLTLYGILYPENIEKMAQVRLSLFSKGLASDKEESSPAKEASKEKSATSTLASGVVETKKSKAPVETNASHVEQLLEKEKELVEREKRVKEMEEKLQQVQVEMESRMQQLDQTRRDIASRLESRVVEEEENIEKLVGVYSNMKPQSAAMVLSKLDEGLAIAILKKMKKQDAGSILNFLDTQKAKVLSEKYSGY